MESIDTSRSSDGRHVLVALEDCQDLGRGVLAGIVAVVRDRSGVTLHVVDGVACAVQTLATGYADGAVVSTGDDALLAAAARTGKPCVNVYPHLAAHPRVPVVATDERATGRVIAEHYLERGFERFAVFRAELSPQLGRRCEGFVDAVRTAGRTCEAAPEELHAGGECPDHLIWDKACGEWLAGLPKPVAVMAPSDHLASACVLACRVHGLRVPDEVSVIGAGDDERFCRTSRPELSSVRFATGEIGRQAIRLLLSMIDGGAAPAEPILLAPADVVARESSGESAVSEPDVAAAVAFIAKHVRRRLTVRDVVEHLAISRRALERQFVEVLGRTPLEEIRRVRIRRAKQLLMGTDLTLSEIARECGFIRHQRLANAFKAATGMTPSAFRARTLSTIGRNGP